MNLNTKTLTFVFLTFLNIALAIAPFAFAQEGLKNPLGSNDLETVIQNIIKAVLGLTALVAVGFVIYGGFLYISAAGETSQIDQGKKAIYGAVVGLIVIGLAYALVEFIVNALGGGGGNSQSNL